MSVVSHNSNRRSRWAALLALLVVTAFYAQTFRTVSPTVIHPEPAGYYSLLADALLAGQLHLKVEPPPALLQLANPYAGAQGVPRLHDASLYHGRYYLYFSAVPVVLLYGPWQALTGTFLQDGAGTVLFSYIAFLLMARLWCRLRNAWTPALPAGWTAATVFILGLSYPLVLAQTEGVYGVPIACAMACLFAALNAIERALTTDVARRRAVWMGLAGLTWALAVAARPNYFLSSPLILGPVALLWWRTRREEATAWSWRAWRIPFWTLLPALTVAVALVSYNAARFDSWSEFGVKYQLAGSDQSQLQVLSLRYVPSHLVAYLTAGAHYSPYFPFVFPLHAVTGLAPWTPLALLGLLFPLCVRSPAGRWRTTGLVLGGLLAGIVLTNLAVLSATAYAHDRYVADFQPSALLLALIALAWLLPRLPRLSRLARRTLLAFCAVLASWTVVHQLSLALLRHPGAELTSAVARVSARWMAAVEPWLGVRHGPVLTQLRWPPAAAAGTREPLLVSGHGRDRLFVEWLEHGAARVGFEHRGNHPIWSAEFPVVPDQPVELSLDLGSLYPIREHPRFATWSEGEVRAVQRRVYVRLNDRVLLDRASDFYPAHPLELDLFPRDSRWRHRLLAQSRPGLARPAAPERWTSGAVRLRVRFRPHDFAHAEPLLSLGSYGRGELFYVQHLAPGRARFGHDSAGAGAMESREVTFDPDQEHELHLETGALVGWQPDMAENGGPMQMRLNGELILSSRRLAHPAEPYDILFGYNGCGSSAAAASFSGTILSTDRVACLPLPDASEEGFGPLALTLRLTAQTLGGAEPLVVSGRSGRGDFVYLRHTGETTIVIGYDHWGVGGHESPPITVNAADPLTIRVSMGSLFPAADSPWWGTTPTERRHALLHTVLVMVDDQTVLELPVATYPAATGEVWVGRNPLGGSTCGPIFRGEELTSARIALPAF